MFTLNLLSEKQKAEVRFEIYSRFLIQIGVAILVTLIIFSILLVPTFIFLQFQKGDLERNLEIERKSQETTQIIETEKEIENTNSLILSMLSAEKKRNKMGPLIADIYSAADGLAVISEFKFTINPKEILLRGRSEDIKKFLLFKDALDALPYFSEKVISPSENLVKLKNVSFTLRGKLK